MSRTIACLGRWGRPLELDARMVDVEAAQRALYDGSTYPFVQLRSIEVTPVTLGKYGRLQGPNSGPLFCVLLISLLTSALAGNSPAASTLASGNVVASVNYFTGSINPPRFVAEFEPAGQYVQTVANRPSTQFDQELRDLVVGNDNAIYAIYGSANAELARLDLGTRSWTTRTFPDWA